MDWYFDHERLQVYQAARQLNRDVNRLLETVPRGHAESRDNLQRAAKSIARNLAEGAGRWRVADKVRFYHIARASATECAACLDELVDYGIMREEEARSVKQILASVVAMLIAMIRSLSDPNAKIGR